MIRTTSLITLALAAGLLAPVASAAEPSTTASLERRAETARTAADHLSVARQYRERAESLDARAARHEAEAQRLEVRPRSPMELKWPGMATQPWVKERRLAVQARRAAHESRLVADRHRNMGVEMLAGLPEQTTTSAAGAN